jgi:hypothetical protein
LPAVPKLRGREEQEDKIERIKKKKRREEVNKKNTL